MQRKHVCEQKSISLSVLILFFTTVPGVFGSEHLIVDVNSQMPLRCKSRMAHFSTSQLLGVTLGLFKKLQWDYPFSQPWNVRLKLNHDQCEYSVVFDPPPGTPEYYSRHSGILVAFSRDGSIVCPVTGAQTGSGWDCYKIKQVVSPGWMPLTKVPDDPMHEPLPIFP